MKFDVLNRFSGKIQFTAEIECAEDSSASFKLGLAVRWAIKAGADLADADLADADLADADLARADLAGADLADANLARADLARANLARADLAGADLAGANLAGANLAGADLAGANLAGANLAGAKNLNKKGVAETPKDDVPIVPNIDAAILAAIETGGVLDMGSWHGPNDEWCGTTHCRAGWAIHLAGEKGKALQDKYGPHIAGAMIYRASRPGVHAPWFFAPTNHALADIRKCAAEQVGNT